MAGILSHTYTNSTNPAGAGSYSLNAPNYCRANLPALADHLIDSLMLYDSFSSHSLESSWSALRDAITLSTSIFAPSASIPSKASPRWFNASIRHQLNKVHSLCSILSNIQPKCLEQDSCRWKEIFNLSSSLPKRII